MRRLCSSELGTTPRPPMQLPTNGPPEFRRGLIVSKLASSPAVLVRSRRLRTSLADHADLAVESLVAEPVDLRECCPLDVLNSLPWSLVVNQLARRICTVIGTQPPL